MMSNKQIEEFIAHLNDKLVDAEEEYNVSRIEILSTVLAVALGGIRAEAKLSGDLKGVEEDLASMGIIFDRIEDVVDEFDMPTDETIH